MLLFHRKSIRKKKNTEKEKEKKRIFVTAIKPWLIWFADFVCDQRSFSLYQMLQ